MSGTLIPINDIALEKLKLIKAEHKEKFDRNISMKEIVHRLIMKSSLKEIEK